MATVNLLPNAEVSNDWTLGPAGSAGDVFEMVNEDSTSRSSTDASRVYTTSVGDKFRVEFTDFTESYSSIDSVQLVVRATVNTRGASFVIGTELTNETTPASLYYAENSSILSANVGYSTITYTSRTTSDGSNAWTNAQLNNIRATVEADAISAGTCHCTYVYIIVTYTEPTDNAIFFGTNF